MEKVNKVMRGWYINKIETYNDQRIIHYQKFIKKYAMSEMMYVVDDKKFNSLDEAKAFVDDPLSFTMDERIAKDDMIRFLDDAMAILEELGENGFKVTGLLNKVRSESNKIMKKDWEEEK